MSSVIEITQAGEMRQFRVPGGIAPKPARSEPFQSLVDRAEESATKAQQVTQALLTNALQWDDETLVEFS